MVNQQPADLRLQVFSTLAEQTGFNTAQLEDGVLSFVKATGLVYFFDKATNTWTATSGGGGGAPYAFQASFKPGTGLGGAGGAPNTYQQYIPGGPNSDVIQGLTERFVFANGFLVYRADNTVPGRFLITCKVTVTGGTQDILFTLDHNDEIMFPPVGPQPAPDTIPGWVRISDSGATVNGQYVVSRIFDAEPDDTFCLIGLMPAAGGGTSISQMVWEAVEVSSAVLPV